MLEFDFILKIFATLIGIYALRYVQLKFKRRNVNKPETIMIIFGSGGHTSEMMMILKDFDFNEYKTIYFLKASSDITTKPKFDLYIQEKKFKIDENKFFWFDIPRSREVKQSYFTSILTTIHSTLYCYYILTFKLKNVDLLCMLSHFILLLI